MCCLFGVLDPNHIFSGKELSGIVRALAVEAEERGTDATGIAYNAGNRLCVYKRPQPAHKLRLRIPDNTHAVMGHTRMTTQGSEKQNFNNHPFLGVTRQGQFALAHNGVLLNDRELRVTRKLPSTSIRTDSYIAVQLICREGKLDFESLKAMAEAVDGSFTFTVLDQRDDLYVVKGDNPFCLYHWKEYGVYLYASTEAILNRALADVRLPLGKPERIYLECGDILRIDNKGRRTTRYFCIDSFMPFAGGCYHSMFWDYEPYSYGYDRPGNRGYLQDLKDVASCLGVEPDRVDHLLRNGFTFEEMEELIYAGEI